MWVLRLLAVVDVHGDILRFEKLIRDSRADVLIIAGDVSPYRSVLGYRSVLKPLSTYSHNFKYIFIVPGNMDPEDVVRYAETLADNVYSLHFKSHVVGEYIFIGAGGSPPTPFATLTEYPDEIIESRLRSTITQAIKKGNYIVLVTHAPPYGCKVDRIYSGEHVGSKGIRRVIESYNPILCICGHIHEAAGVDVIGSTVVVNPGPLMRGNYAIIDIEGPKITRLEVAKVKST